MTTLQDSPRDAPQRASGRCIGPTWLPAPSQEVAAQVLGLPSSTYRRHLSAGLRAITDILWEQELHAKRKEIRGSDVQRRQGLGETLNSSVEYADP